MSSSAVLVVGSANMDLVVRSPRFPSPGETLLGGPFETFAGGKGANQAVAIARLGGEVALLCSIGRDGFGHELHNSLIGSGVQPHLILESELERTGVAAITVDDAGQNTIVVAPGANMLLRGEDTRRAASGFGVQLAQLEVPLAALEPLGEDGATLILNPAPARELPDPLLARVAFLVPNETETATLTGIEPSNESSCRKAADRLFERGVREVIITLGPNGCYWANRVGGKHFPARHVQPVDTTAAGDAFCGAFAYFLASGRSVEHAIELAGAAAALSCTRRGAQASMPTWAELAAFAPDLVDRAV